MKCRVRAPPRQDNRTVMRGRAVSLAGGVERASEHLVELSPRNVEIRRVDVAAECRLQRCDRLDWPLETQQHFTKLIIHSRKTEARRRNSCRELARCLLIAPGRDEHHAT